MQTFTYKIMIAFSLMSAVTPANNLSATIVKIDDNLYVGKKDKLYFALERVTKETIEFWQAYAHNQLDQAIKRYDLNSKKLQESDEYQKFQKAEKLAQEKHEQPKKEYIALHAHKEAERYDSLLQQYEQAEKAYNSLLREPKKNVDSSVTLEKAKKRVDEIDQELLRAFDDYTKKELELGALYDQTKSYEEPTGFESVKKAVKGLERDLTLIKVIRSFNKALHYYPINPVWIAYVTEKKITSPAAKIPLRLEKDIEMVVTVSTDSNIPFYTPMGIFRAAEFSNSPNKNLSMQLQSFVAQAITTVYGNKKKYMITKPLQAMLDIMMKNLPKESIWLDDQTNMLFRTLKKGSTITIDPLFGQKVTLKIPEFIAPLEFYKGSMMIVETDALANFMKLDTLDK